MGSSPDRLTIVSSDSHATVPPALWTEYLEKRFHEHLPRLQQENETWPGAMWLLSSQQMQILPGLIEQHRDHGALGAQQLEARLSHMDDEGVAAELVYHGDFRTSDLFHCTSNGVYPMEAWDAGVRAYHRWITDAFGASDRILRVGAVGPCTDMEATLAELAWIADHGFTATFAPGFMTHPDMPLFFDPVWGRFFAVCEEAGLPLVVHAGYGFGQGVMYPAVEQAFKEGREKGNSDMQIVMDLADFFGRGEFFSDLKARKPMWQLMLGGVFDRHPGLKLLLTEIRADWIPAVLQYLDALYEKNRSDFPAKRKPSEYWENNCMAGVSFVHKAEVEMRHEIGVEQFAFGRDYPHPEGTWPNSLDWIRDAFAGVPADELRAMLGGNMVRFFGLDGEALDAVASQVGPNIDEILGGSDIDPGLRDSFDLRGGYLKPAERDAKLARIEEMLREDLARAGMQAV